MKKAIKAHTHYTQEVRRHLESVFNVNELLFYSLCGSVLQISFKVYPFRSKSAQAGYEAFKSRHLNANRKLQVGLFLIVWPTERVQSLSFFFAGCEWTGYWQTLARSEASSLGISYESPWTIYGQFLSVCLTLQAVNKPGWYSFFCL